METCLDQIKNIFSKSAKSKLAIVGKGATVDAIDKEKLYKDYFVIGLNDAEVIINADISLFYRDDLQSIIRLNGFKSAYYIAPGSFMLPEDKHVAAAYQAFDQEGMEKIYSYFAAQDFYILDFTLLSAIKLAILFQQQQPRSVEVAFLGFDFYLEAVADGDMQGLDYRNAYLRTQESLFITLLEHIREQYPLMHLRHIGNKKYSESTVSDFNQHLAIVDGNIGSLSNGERYRAMLAAKQHDNGVIVVAELTNNHIGSKERLIKMVELAHESGADMIKVQKRDVETFYSKEELDAPYQSPFGNTLGAYRHAVELGLDLFEILESVCARLGMPWFASVLDWNSYLFMQNLDCPIIKLPSTISNHKNYLKKVFAAFNGDLVVSTGFTAQDYEHFVLENAPKDKRLFLLQCTSSYPTPPQGCHINVVRHYDNLRTKFPHLVPGYSSHDLGSLGCIMAVAAGARMVEKHVKLGELEWVHFDSVAIDLYNNHFKNFVHDIRKAELMCGSHLKSVQTFEHHKYSVNNIVN